MAKSKTWLLAAGILGASFVGGAAAHWLVGGRPAYGGDERKTAKSVSAQQFVLTDAAGKTRAALQLGRRDAPGLALYDRAGAVRATLSLSDTDEPGLSMSGKNGKTRISLRLEEDGAGLRMADARGVMRTNLAVGAKGNPALLHYDAAARIRGVLVLREGQGIGLSLGDGAGATRAVLMVHPTDGAVLRFMDKSKKAIWQAPSAPDK